ncbi:hypothetical protein CPB86DRAFT_796049 [Serendipita vermifera]|nr:hypothetical protein CPB86DRAFT_796049 [Serendipita vermifera]
MAVAVTGDEKLVTLTLAGWPFSPSRHLNPHHRVLFSAGCVLVPYDEENAWNAANPDGVIYGSFNFKSCIGGNSALLGSLVDSRTDKEFRCWCPTAWIGQYNAALVYTFHEALTSVGSQAWSFDHIPRMTTPSRRISLITLEIARRDWKDRVFRFILCHLQATGGEVGKYFLGKFANSSISGLRVNLHPGIQCLLVLDYVVSASGRDSILFCELLNGHTSPNVFK